ncbi:LuxR C-terminal-related transcriptional regulator [Saccharopolyspora hirsuta]|uniref:helix-turn-helix transcriptional regulator n=1 Tax=Saccharopolyspora hirsuta TaxID=1837 RepID=UPI00332BCFDF
MSLGPRLVPSRRRALDELVAAVAKPRARSELVVVTAAVGGGLSTFVRAFADRCGPAGDVVSASTHHLLGLPWEHEPGTVLERLVAAPADSPPVAARRWLDSLGGSSSDGQPVWDAVVVLEDAQHADAFSVQALVSAAQRPGAHRVLIVLGWCESAAPRGAFADDSLRDAVLAAARRVVRLGGLTADDVAALAEQRGIVLPAHQVERLVGHAGGRVRDVVEILDEVPADDWSSPHFSLPAPATAARAIRARLETLPAQARQVVAAVAVLEAADRQSRAADVVDAGRVAGVADVVAAVDRAHRAGLLTLLDEHGAWARLPDPVARRAVLDELGPLRRSELHSKAAEVVADPALALRHRWFAAPRPDAELGDRLEELAAERAHQGAWAAAADLLLLASQAGEDLELRGARLLRAVDALVGAGEVPRASRYLAQLESLRETPLRNAVLGYLAVVRGRPAEAENRLGRAWELVNAHRDPSTASLVAQRYVLHHLARCRPRSLVEWADRAIGLVEPDAPTAVEAAAIRGLGVAPVDGAEVALRGYPALMERVPEGPVLQRVTMAAGWLHLAADAPDRAREELESALPTDFLGGSLRISLWAHGWLARVQFAIGEWAEALRTATAGLELAERSGMNLLVPLLAWTRTQVHALRGDWDAAESSLRAGDAGARDYEIMRVPAALARAALCEARADYAAVVRALEPLSQPWAREWVSQPGFWPWTDVYANALVLIGRSEEADAFLTHHEEAADARQHASARARLAYARGRWHGMRGDLDAARASFERAIGLLEPLPLRYDRARVHFAFGQTLRRAGRRAEADAVITTARDAYLALGADTYVARCERELAAGGVNAVRGHREFDELTPQEEAVAELVAQGRSNKAVAAELFISVKTVQYHLTRIYAKIGVRSRAELAARRAQQQDGTSS